MIFPEPGNYATIKALLLELAPDARLVKPISRGARRGFGIPADVYAAFEAAMEPKEAGAEQTPAPKKRGRPRKSEQEND